MVNSYKKVYIIDDSTYTAVTLRKILTELNFNVVGSSTNADDGIEQVQAQKDSVKIIILDIYLGKESGVDLIPRLLDINPEFIIIMISSNTDNAIILDCIKKGAKHYLLKPFNYENVKKVMGKFCEPVKQ